MKCYAYSKRKDGCSARITLTVVIEQLVLTKFRKITTFVRENKTEFIELAIQNLQQKQSTELKAAKKRFSKQDKSAAELDKPFTRIYEDNVSEKSPMSVSR